MTRHDATSALSAQLDESRLDDAVEEIIARLQAGEFVTEADCQVRYPDCAAALAPMLPGLQAMVRFGAAGDSVFGANGTSAEAGPVQKVLGDYRILREVGRGGMGVVYEAEQISLARRVALKILPFAAVLDPRHLQRFKNEAMAAAHLDHPNIVEVYGIGCERSIHFYAMRFVEGVTLAEVVSHRLEAVGGRPEGNVEVLNPNVESNPNDEARTEAFSPSHLLNSSPSSHSSLITPHSSLRAETERVLQAALCTVNSAAPKERFRRIAEIGIEAAEALDHAHQMGIVHRDIKPSNLMLDERGKLWVTDFGLARSTGEASMTMTGDLVGTLRYMSPEQALAKRITVDHRTDIYSLGVTLYELLTLRAAFPSNDREETLRQIAFEEPTKPRKLDKSIPEELETIILKAMEKNPDDRYATARELADDLRRWVEHKPIVARAPGVVLKAKKWARRHSGPLFAAGAVFALAAIALGVTSYLAVRAYHEEFASRQKAEHMTSVAAGNVTTALQAIDKMLVQIASEELKFVPEADPVRRSLLATAVELCEELRTRADVDEKVTLELCLIYQKLGELAGALGERDQQEQVYQKSIALGRELVEQNPSNARAHEVVIQGLIAYSQSHYYESPHTSPLKPELSKALQERGRLPASVNSLRLEVLATEALEMPDRGRMMERLLALRERLVGAPVEWQDETAFWEGLAHLFDLAAQLEEGGGQYEGALLCFGNAVEFARRANLDVMDYEMRQQNVLRSLGRFDEAREICQRSLARELGIEERSPARARVMPRFAHYDMGKLEMAAGNSEAAINVLRSGMEKWKAAILAGSRDRLWGFANTSHDLSTVLLRDGQIDAGFSVLQQEIETWKSAIQHELQKQSADSNKKATSDVNLRAMRINFRSVQLHLALLQCRLGLYDQGRTTYEEVFSMPMEKENVPERIWALILSPFDELRDNSRIQELLNEVEPSPQREFIQAMALYFDGDSQPLRELLSRTPQDEMSTYGFLWMAVLKANDHKDDALALCARAADRITEWNLLEHRWICPPLMELRKSLLLPSDHPLARKLRQFDPLRGRPFIAEEKEPH